MKAKMVCDDCNAQEQFPDCKSCAGRGYVERELFTAEEMRKAQAEAWDGGRMQGIHEETSHDPRFLDNPYAEEDGDAS